MVVKWLRQPPLLRQLAPFVHPRFIVRCAPVFSIPKFRGFPVVSGEKEWLPESRGKPCFRYLTQFDGLGGVLSL